jgi:hypothetical protein
MNLVKFSVRLILVATIAMQLTNANASSNAGIEFDLGEFHLNVYYSDALDYNNEADETIRNPRSTLFTLASTIQANAGTIAKIAHTLQVELYTRADSTNNYLLITEDPQSQSTILRDGVVGKDITKEILLVVCGRYPDACKRPASNEVILYSCKETNCAGQIRFGSFPSESINNSFGLVKPALFKKRVSVTREKIGRYFEKLD